MEEFPYSHKYIDIPETSPENYKAVVKHCLNSIPKLYRDKKVEDFFEVLLPGKCSRLGIEYPYFDADYLSLYYSYYAKTFRQYKKECCRIVLYGKDNSCLGYVVLRPLPMGKKIGKTYLDPTVFVSDSCYIICGPHKLHYLGKEATIYAMPYMKQEELVTVCAHVCVWSTIRFFSSRFSNHVSHTIGEIAEKIASPFERKTGLTPKQISASLVDLGFDSLILSDGMSTPIDEQICAYLDSGLPVICCSSSRKHAVVACGRAPISADKARRAKIGHMLPHSKRILSFESSLVERFVVNDDYEMPYKFIDAKNISLSLVGENDHGDSSGRRRNKPLSIREIDTCVVPLDRQMQLTYPSAKDIIEMVFDDTYTTTESNDSYFSSLSIVSSNTFKEWIRENILEGKLPRSFTRLLWISYPKFLWLGTFSSVDEYCRGECSGFVLLDPTCAINDISNVLLIADNVACRFMENSSEYGDVPMWMFTYEKFAVPLFKKNYVEVRM